MSLVRASENLRSGGRILIDQLVIQGVDNVFCVPGESYLSALDALFDAPIALTTCRQEGGAAMMAEAYGKLTGRPGICFVTRGPGATNASAGLHIARQDSTPMLLFVGQVDRGFRKREAFQELDCETFFRPITKWAVEIDDPARIPELIARAFHVATNGRPGPVAIALPEDVLTEQIRVADAEPHKITESMPSAAGLAELETLLDQSRRPLIIAGGSRWNQAGVDRLVAFSERFDLPVAVSFRRQSLFPTSHKNYGGDLGVSAHPDLVKYVRAADLILLIGDRFSEIPSRGYTLLQVPRPSQRLVHVHPDPEEIGRVYQADLAFPVSPAAFLTSVDNLRPRSKRDCGPARDLRRSYISWSETPTNVPGRFNLGEAIVALRSFLPDAIITNGAGNYAVWLHRYHRYQGYASQLAPTSGSMGYGIPAAVAAARVQSDRPVIAFAGDGCFLMHGQEFATAVQYGLPIVVVIVDNGMYGTIRMHQERHYPGRVTGTELRNPDFAAYATTFGGHGERVTDTKEFIPALKRAIASGVPSILHCICDPEAITPTETLAGIRAAAARTESRVAS